MAQERPNGLAEWIELLRELPSDLRERWVDWRAAVREEPALIWETPGVRYVAYGLTAVAVLWVVSGVVGMLVPPPPADARPVATTADFHVVCTHVDCRDHFVIHRKFGYRRFPVPCPRCGQNTGECALRCNSPACQGRWVAPTKSEGKSSCPVCDRQFH